VAGSGRRILPGAVPTSWKKHADEKVQSDRSRRKVSDCFDFVDYLKARLFNHFTNRLPKPTRSLMLKKDQLFDYIFLKADNPESFDSFRSLEHFHFH
jgi:hypothetical protein